MIETLSVIIQVSYFKLTGGQRIFRMSPIHHHYELKGWKETKVFGVFCCAGVVFGILGLLILGMSR